MLTAIILVCSIATTPNLADCNADTARIVMRNPEGYASPAACAMQGQAEIAETAIGRYLKDTDRVKIVCMPDFKAAKIQDTLPQ